MWHDLLVALALVMVIEGIIPFISPRGLRNLLQSMLEMDDGMIRAFGLISMLLGVGMLYLVN